MENLEKQQGELMLITKRLNNETARDYALRTLNQNIILLELEPGCRVSENELAKEMGISRTPTREALIELSKSQIVDIYPQKGSYISLIDYSIVDEAMFLRQVLEKAVVELACDMATAEDISDLSENVNLQQFYYETHIESKILTLDNQFHKKLFEICNKHRSYDLMNSMMVHCDRVRIITLENSKVMIDIINDHREILELIKKRDKEAVVESMTKHLSRYKVDKDAVKDKYPNFFKV